MLEWLFGWEVTSVVVVAAASFAFAVLALNDFRLAKTFFLIAAADAVGGILVNVNRSGLNLIWQGGLVFVAGGSVCLLLFLAMRYVDGKKGKISEPPPSHLSEPATAVYVGCSPLPLPFGIGPSSFARMMMVYPQITPFSDMLVTVASAQDAARGYPAPTDIEPLVKDHPFDKDLFRFQTAMRCEVSSHGTAVLQDLEIPIHILFFREEDVRYKEKEKNFSDRIYGPPKAAPVAEIWRTVRINPLDASASFNFYAINICPKLIALISIPTSATARVLGGNGKKEITLQRAELNVFGPQILLPASSMHWKGYENVTPQQ